MSLRDPEECICNVVSGGMPCASSRCIRLPSWEKNMRDLSDRIRAVTGVPPADIGPIIPPPPLGERAGIFVLASAQPARIGTALSYIAQRCGSPEDRRMAPPCWCGYCRGSAGVHGYAPRICVEEHADPVAYDRAGCVVPARPVPEVPRDPSWQEHRKTWLETGDMSALTAMDQYDPARMSGDDWLDCDEYDAKRAPVPELPPSPSARHRRVATVMQIAALLSCCCLLAVLIARGVI